MHLFPSLCIEKNGPFLNWTTVIVLNQYVYFVKHICAIVQSNEIILVINIDFNRGGNQIKIYTLTGEVINI